MRTFEIACRLVVCPLIAITLSGSRAVADEPAVKGVQVLPPAAAAVPDVSPLSVEGIVNAPVGEVWRVFSTSEGFKSFGVAKCDIDFRVGGLMRACYSEKSEIGDPTTIQNRILSFEPERMVAFRIDKPPQGFPFMNSWQSVWSVVTMSGLGDGRTALRMTQVGYTAEDESQKMREFFKMGNAWSLQKLQKHFDASVQVAPPTLAHAEDPLASIEEDVVVAGPREEVFSVYTTSAGWKSFFNVESKIELRPGGPFEIYFSMEPPAGSRGSEGCMVLSYIPNRMFSYTWNAPPKFAAARVERTWVVVTFDDLGLARTKVHISHLGFAEMAAAHADRAEEYKEVRGYFAKAWPHVLGALKAKWETGQGR